MGVLDLFLLSCRRRTSPSRHRGRPKTFHIWPERHVFTALMFALGIAMAFGKASVFNISGDYPATSARSAASWAGGRHGRLHPLPIMFRRAHGLD